MNIEPRQKRTSLRTSLDFEVSDNRGRHGFPNDQRGLVFIHREERTVYCKHTGVEIPRRNGIRIRIDGQSDKWRIDLMPDNGPVEAVYDTDDKTALFDSNHEAAQALERRLIYIERNSTVGSGAGGAV